MGQNKNKKGPHGNRFIDLTGQKFERLTVIRYQGRNSHGSLWECLCECGNTVIVGVASLRSKHTRSCGCLLTEKSRALLTRHGQTDTPTWRSWASMLRRCLNPKDINYKNYGGRGIVVCATWSASFQRFLEDMGERPSKNHSIDRKDTNGNYEPDNCRWATRKEQGNNSRRNRFLEHDGRRMTVTQWADAVGLPAYTIFDRLRRGWSIARALTEPSRLQANAHKAEQKAA